MSARSAVGIVGVGAMGLAIAERLRAQRFPVTVRDIRRGREQLAARCGATIAKSPSDLAAHCPIVLSVVVDSKQTEDVVFGERGLVRGMRPGAVLLLCSTVAPAFAAFLARRLASHGVLMIDAPMSGGPLRARDGSMSMMLAGPEAARSKAKAVLAAMSNKRFDLGSRPGDGAAAKIVNNLMAGANLAAAAEGVALAIKLGLDPDRALDVVNASSGQSWIGEERMRRALRGDYALRASPAMLAKDLGIAIEAAADLAMPTPLAGAARSIFLAAISLGHVGTDDASALKVYEAIGGVGASRAPRTKHAIKRKQHSARAK
ncbi:MAG: NAD(P)-dependent oxidoreductase [Burkholderiales bacterium]